MSGRGSGRLGSRVEYTIQTCDPSVSRTAVRWGPQFSSGAPPRSPAPPFDHFPFGPAILRRRVQSGTCAWVRRNFSRGQQAGATGEEAAEGRKGGGGQGRAWGRETKKEQNGEAPGGGGKGGGLGERRTCGGGGRRNMITW